MSSPRKSKYLIGDSFCALPHKVVDSQAFNSLAGSSLRLLIIALRLYNGKNNDQIHLTLANLKKRGWNSNSTLTGARPELQSKGFIQMSRI